MKTYLTKVALLLAIVVLFASCAQRDLGLSTMVPSEALGFVQISDPEKFLADSDAFIEPLGVKEMLGNLGLKDLFRNGLKMAAKLDLEAVDLKRPMGVAFLPPKDSSSEFSVIVYLPLVKPEESSPKLEELLKTIPGASSTIYKGYGIYYTGNKLSFPIEKPMQIPESLTFESGTLSAYLDLGSTLKRFATEYEDAKKKALSELQTNEEAMEGSSLFGPGMNKVSASMVTEMFNIVEETRSMALHLKADSHGMATGMTLEFKSDGAVTKLIKDLGPGKDISSLTKYLPVNSLYSAAVSANPLAFKNLNKTIMDMYFEALSIDEPTKVAFTALMDDSYKIMGKNTSVSFDLSLDPKFIDTPETEIGANLSKLFQVSLIAVRDVTNGVDYQKLLMASVENGAVTNYFNKMLEPMGFTFGMTLSDQKDGNFAWQELKFKLDPAKGSDLSTDSEASRSMATMAKDLLQKFTVAVAVKNNKAFMVMGEKATTVLKHLVENDKVESSVDQTEAWKTWLKTVPNDAQLMGNLSIARIFDIAKVLSKNSVSLDIPAGDRGGIFSWVRAKDSQIQTAGFWSLKEITPVVKEGMKSASVLEGLFSGSKKTQPTWEDGMGAESQTSMPEESEESAR